MRIEGTGCVIDGIRAFSRRAAELTRPESWLLLIAGVAFALVTSGCRAQAPVETERPTAAFASAQVLLLRDSGAVGDGRTDDTEAVQRALSKSGHYCIDGEGRSYRVSGTLRVEDNLCLRNVVLVQTLEPFDTRPYVRRSCPTTLDASAVIDCGDPAIPADQLSRLRQSLSVRTLLIRRDHGGPIRVTLDHVKVDRGRHPEGGSRTDSAGIWLEHADGVDLRNVEVTGFGKGYGLIVLRSSNVTVDDLSIHDLVWSPYLGDAPLTQKRVSAIGWNSVPVHEFRQAGQDGVATSKFYGVRVQEQVTCAVFAEVHNVMIRNVTVSRCMARFTDGDLPWQADGLDIGASSSKVTVDGAAIDSTWEGMDVVAGGDGVDGLIIHNARVSNSFGFGLKLGYQLRNVQASNVTVSDAGIAGVVLYGPVEGVMLSKIRISGLGTVSADGATLVPWLDQRHSGILISHGPTGGTPAQAAPRDILIDDVTVAKAQAAPAYDFGIFNNGGTQIHIRQFHAIGFSKAEATGIHALR